MLKNCLLGLFVLLSLTLAFALFVSLARGDAYKASYLLEQQISNLRQQYLYKTLGDLPASFQAREALSENESFYEPHFDIDGLDEIDYFGVQVTTEHGKIVWIGKYKP